MAMLLLNSGGTGATFVFFGLAECCVLVIVPYAFKTFLCSSFFGVLVFAVIFNTTRQGYAQILFLSGKKPHALGSC